MLVDCIATLYTIQVQPIFEFSARTVNKTCLNSETESGKRQGSKQDSANSEHTHYKIAEFTFCILENQCNKQITVIYLYILYYRKIRDVAID